MNQDNSVSVHNRTLKTILLKSKTATAVTKFIEKKIRNRKNLEFLNTPNEKILRLEEEKIRQSIERAKAKGRALAKLEWQRMS